MNYIREFFYRPKRNDDSLMACFFYADEALNCIAAELDSFDGRKDPDRCSSLVARLRSCQDNVLSICFKMIDLVDPGSCAAIREFRVKFPDEIMTENLAGQLWFGAECLSSGSSIMNKEQESEAMRPLAKSVTKSLERVRSLLRVQSTSKCPQYTETIQENLKIFNNLFAQFEYNYVQCMVHVKSIAEYEVYQDVIVLFSETVIRSLNLGMISQETIDYCDPSLMFAIPRLGIVYGLLINSDGPLSMSKPSSEFPELFLPFRNLLRKIRELLLSLDEAEVEVLEMLLCQLEEPANVGVKLDEVRKRLIDKKASQQASKLQCKLGGDGVNDEHEYDEDPVDKQPSNLKQHEASNIAEKIIDGVILDVMTNLEHSSYLIDCSFPTITVTQTTDVKKEKRHRTSCERRRANGCGSTSSSCSTESVVQTSTPLRRQNARRDPKRIPLRYQKQQRLKFKSTEDLLHRLYVCISGAADQLQSNYAGDFRSILHTVFLINSSASSEVKDDDEASISPPPINDSVAIVAPPENPLPLDLALDALTHQISTSLAEQQLTLSQPSNSASEGAAYAQNIDLQLDDISSLSYDNLEPMRRYYQNEDQLLNYAEGGTLPVETFVPDIEFSDHRDLTPPLWLPDEVSAECMACHVRFTIVRRKHHCRACGGIFCHKCSMKSVPLVRYGMIKPVRVCNRCYALEMAYNSAVVGVINDSTGSETDHARSATGGDEECNYSAWSHNPGLISS